MSSNFQANRRPGGGGGARALFPLATGRLPPELADNARILADYAAALRDIADHPALEPERKQERLQALAAAIRGESTSGGIDDGLRAAHNLRHLLDSRGFDFQDPWQMLQAASLDISKSSYPDWSDLLAWCRYWAAPMGRMVYRLAGGGDPGLARAESFAIGAEVLFLVEHAPAHHRWLGRVYLPARWFREAGCEPEVLGAAGASPELRQVFGRAVGEARRLIDAAAGIETCLPTRRHRVAAATARAEALAWAGALERGDLIAGVSGPGFVVRVGIGMAGMLGGMRS
ncbi:MAG: squalene/phytoene synthase family protein [Alphaproteobacteria bacterium]|nr:squalene/phytoene synthase family protein [Alphaproteobacteria bacterium]